MEFEQIYKAYFKSVYLYVMQLSGNEHIAEEIISETFYKAINSIDSFRGDCDMRVWLCQITKNTYYSYLKKKMKSIRKKFRKKACVIAAIIAAVCLVLCIMLNYFPVYRLVQFWSTFFSDYYSYEQVSKALYIGSTSDRREAQSVLRLADKAFHDTRHTRTENEEEYGLLARYATPTDSYDNVAFVEYSLELLSTHLDDDEGLIWVYYSSEAFDHDGNTVCGSWRIPSLWEVEKNDAGEWVVVQIREHP